MLSRGAITEEAAKELHRQAAEASPSDGIQDFSAFVSSLNKRLKPLGMELANVRMESSGEKWVGVANRAQDAASKIATSYTLAELEFFRKAMEYLVLEGEGSVDSMTLLHMAATLERKLSQKAAQEFLETLVLDNWLHEAEGVYTPGPRFLLELRPFLKEMFGEGDITDCASCKDPVVRGQLCGKFGCSIKLHPYCAARLASGRDMLKCPQCAQPWEHELPDIVTEQQPPLESTPGPSGCRSSMAGSGNSGAGTRRASGSKSNPHSKRSKSRPS
eukprot:Em0023g352a